MEVIGNILSRLSSARDVVIASATCRKWREAWRVHLHTLSFNSNDWPVYHELTTSRLEILITQTIFQTTGLQCLSIIMDDVDEFSAAPVIGVEPSHLISVNKLQLDSTILLTETDVI